MHEKKHGRAGDAGAPCPAPVDGAEVACEICSWEEAHASEFVVVLSRYNEGWLLSRHQMRDTWETQGGHIEMGETAEAAALRELYEEAGAIASELVPLCGYWASRGGIRRYGKLFYAEIDRLDPLPKSEIEQVQWFATLPERGKLTYPEITPVLYAHAQAYLAQKKPQ